MPPEPEVEAEGRDQAYSAQYQRWKQSHEPLFGRIALTIPRDGSLLLYGLDLKSAQFSLTHGRANGAPCVMGFSKDWMANRRTFAPLAADPMVVECARFGPASEWLLLEFDPTYLRERILAEYLNRFLAVGGKLDYDAEVVVAARPFALDRMRTRRWIRRRQFPGCPPRNSRHDLYPAK